MDAQGKVNGNQRGQIVVGIDVGTTKIAVFIGEKDQEGKVHIIGMGKTESIGVQNGEVTGITQTADSIKKAVKMAEDQANYTVTECYVGVAGHNISNSKQRGTMIIKEEDHIISQEDIDKLLEDQYSISIAPGFSIIDIIPQDYIIDGVSGIFDPVGRRGKTLECNYNIISGDERNIHNIHMAVEMAGYKVKNLIMEPIASAEAVVFDDEKSAGICLVDIGGGTTDMAIFKEGILKHIAVIQLAGNAITMDIKDGCKILQNQAEALKTKYGDCLLNEKQKNVVIQIPGLRGRESREITLYMLSQLIRARVEMILDQVDYELKNEDQGDGLLAGIVITGGGSKMPHIAQFTEYITGIPTRVGGPQTTNLYDEQKEFNDPTYSTGIGLVLKGFLNEPEFIPEETTEAYETTPAAEQIEKKETPKKKEAKKAKQPKDKSKSSFVDKVTTWINKVLNDTIE